MNTQADKTQKDISKTVVKVAAEKESDRESTFQFVDNRPKVIARGKLQEITSNSPQVKKLKAFSKEEKAIKLKPKENKRQKNALFSKPKNSALISIVQRAFADNLGIKTVGHFNAQFNRALRGLTFSQKTKLFQLIESDKTNKYTREEIPDIILKLRAEQGYPALEEGKKRDVVPKKKKEAKLKLSPQELKKKKGLTMARMEYPVWEEIEPLLKGYGVVEEKHREKIKETLEKTAPDPNTLIRGIPDLIERAGVRRAEDTAEIVRKAITVAAPEITEQHKSVTVGRGDTRPPHEIRKVGGLFGWDPGIVTIEHARIIVKKVSKMTPQAQTDWANKWKRPTPPPEERNPWVATGGSKQGAQKAADSEYSCTIPLIFNMKQGHAMHIGTDTGNVESANVIGVKLDPQKNRTGDEILVLTGIPWKYITTWNNEDKDKAADKTLKLASPYEE